VLVREQPASDLAVATRILARAGALAMDGRITQRLGDVVYVGARGIGLATMTPYDVAVVLLSDGSTLHGAPPEDMAAYLDAHRRSGHIASVARVATDEYLTASSLPACVVAALRRSRGEGQTHDNAAIERAWLDLVQQARIAGALIGAFPEEETG
jgi:ribulose-5-phosphate 4-epimerase/fuculose-1-phosphate aldolase